MKRYKLVRIVGGRYFSANTRDPLCLEYVVGETISVPYKGIACYKALRYAKTFHNIEETMHEFNGGKPVAILEVEPIGKSIPKVDDRYRVGRVYEGGINYPTVRVVKVATTIRRY